MDNEETRTYHVLCPISKTAGIKAAFEKAGAKDVTAKHANYHGLGLVHGALTEKELAALKRDLKDGHTIGEGRGAFPRHDCT